MPAQVYLYDPATGDRLTALDPGVARPLRWAAWAPATAGRPAAYALIVGNGGTVVRFQEGRFDAIETGTRHNLRGAAFSPDGAQALFVGNRGAVLLYDAAAGAVDGSVRALRSPTSENLRRAAWHPNGEFALIIGNGGTVLRYGSGELTPVPGDRAHTLRAIAWRPDGAYALVGAYASRWAGYPRPHPLYKCDGMYLQALLTSDEEDDFVAVDWHPSGDRALIAGYAYDTPAAGQTSNKVLTYDGSGFGYRAVEASGALLGASWHPSGDYALLCGEGGALLRMTGDRVEQLDSGTKDNLVGPFWRPATAGGADGGVALLLQGPGERVYTV
ncbi:MAG: hypothetical protein WD939_05670 [Dehalococcoidia bacterium]